MAVALDEEARCANNKCTNEGSDDDDDDKKLDESKELEPAVLYKEKINYKYPGGAGFAAHQDAPAYLHVKDLPVCTCLLAVDAATEASGCLEFATSSAHRSREMLAFDKDRIGCVDPAVAEELEWTAAALSPGDALLFGTYVLACPEDEIQTCHT